MRRWLGACLMACLGGLMTANAQIVRIGPHGGVRVRAPFTSVDVLPYGGGTRVRAPFTAVDTGLYQYGIGVPVYAGRGHAMHYAVPLYPVAPVYPVPVYPAPIFPELVYPEIVYPEPAYTTPLPQHAERPIVGLLDDRLRAAAVQLQRSLSFRRDDGDVWQNYLAPQLIIDTIDQGADPKSLRELLRNYNGVVANPSLTLIRNAPGFSETRQLLNQYVERYTIDSVPPPVEQPVTPVEEPVSEPTATRPSEEDVPPPPTAPVPL